MATGVVTWSQTAASNATVDANVNWAEGMAPSQVNDSARAMMASVAKWRDDNTGFIATGGSNTAYTYTSQQGFASLAALSGQTITIYVHATSGVNPTLNVDGLGAKPITIDDQGTNVPFGFLLGGTAVTVTYDNSVGQFYVHHISTQTFIPAGTIWAFGGTSTPTGWLFCDGSAISRSTFAALFTNIGVTWGVGNGSTTFNIPDLRGRAVVGFDSGAIRLSGAAAVGATGGAQSQSVAISTGNIPQMTVQGSQSLGTLLTTSGGQNVGSASPPTINTAGTAITVLGSNFTVGNSSPSNLSITTVQPSAAVNYIIKT